MPVFGVSQTGRFLSFLRDELNIGNKIFRTRQKKETKNKSPRKGKKRSNEKKKKNGKGKYKGWKNTADPESKYVFQTDPTGESILFITEDGDSSLMVPFGNNRNDKGEVGSRVIVETDEKK